MGRSESDIAVIVVNYGTADLSIAAVESVLARHHGGRRIHVHLVDNNSPSGDAAVLARAHAERGWGERVTLWPETENHGFGRGNNVVLKALANRETPPEYVFLLNPDAELANEAIDILAACLDANPRAGTAGAGIELPDGTAVSAAFRFPSFLSDVERALNFGPASRALARRRVALSPDHPGGQVDWVAGAAVLFRFEALADVGFFDPAFFLYYEEVDLMRRMAAAGWETLYLPAARVVHHEGAATNVRSGASGRRRRPAYVYRSWRRYTVKARGRGGALSGALTVWGAAGVGRTVAALRGRETPLPLSFFHDQWVHVIRPLAGLGADPEYDAETARFGIASARVRFAEAARGYVDTNPSDIGFWQLVAEDFRTHGRDPFAQGFWALFVHRFGNWRMGIRTKLFRAPFTLLYKVLAKFVQWICGIDLPYSVIVGRRVKLEHFGGMILIAERIGDDVIIRQNTTFGIAGLADLKGRPSIGERVEIGTGAVIVGRIAVGDDTIIGANAVVTKDLPAGVIAGGVPARVLRERAMEPPDG